MQQQTVRAYRIKNEAEPGLFPETGLIHIDVVTDGERMGECIRRPGREPNARFVTSVRRKEFVKALLSCCRE